MIPEIWSVRDRIFSHFGPFLVLLPLYPCPPLNNSKNQNFEKMKKVPRKKCTINDNHMIYGSWDINCNRQIFLSYWAISCHFTPLTAQKRGLQKVKKATGDIIILQKCTKNHDHVLYCSWDMACDTCNFYFSFWAIFCSFTPATAQIIKISKKWNKSLEISPFYTCVPKIMLR